MLNPFCKKVEDVKSLFLKQIYCKDATSTGDKILPGPSKRKSRLLANMTPQSAVKGMEPKQRAF